MKHWFTRKELDEEDYKNEQWKEIGEQYNIRQIAIMFCAIGILIIMVLYLIFSNSENKINKINQIMTEIEAQTETDN